MPPEFARAVLALVARIPPGRVSTYGTLANLAGYPRHARHVGRLLGHLPDGVSVPWQRVVGAGGRIARPGTPGADQQRLLLEHEGVELSASGRVDLQRYGWPVVDDDTGLD
ncbi:MAG: MGMT family protein [Pseudogulbenkiania sp.]|nr:MGMT family protein [Pseudogulbenkiania sp.]